VIFIAILLAYRLSLAMFPSSLTKPNATPRITAINVIGEMPDRVCRGQSPSVRQTPKCKTSSERDEIKEREQRGHFGVTDNE